MRRQGGGGHEWQGEKLFSVEVGSLITLQLVLTRRQEGWEPEEACGQV